MAITRREAKMIAEEVVNILRPQVVAACKDVAAEENDELLCTKDAAKLIGISHHTLYKTKNVYGCWCKVNGRIKFSKRRLVQRMQAGA